MPGLPDGKCAVVTGTSSGIGQGIAGVFAREGADLAVSFRSNRAGIRRTLEIIEAQGRQAVAGRRAEVPK